MRWNGQWRIPRGLGKMIVVSVNQLRYDNYYCWDEGDFACARRYSHSMLRGSKFPAILVIKEWRGGRKIFEVVDGNHRLFAARRCGFLRIPVIYQVE